MARPGQLFGISRGSTYKAAGAGEIPTIRIGRRLVVPVARLRVILGLAKDSAEGESPGWPAAEARDGPEAA